MGVRATGGSFSSLRQKSTIPEVSEEKDLRDEKKTRFTSPVDAILSSFEVYQSDQKAAQKLGKEQGNSLGDTLMPPIPTNENNISNTDENNMPTGHEEKKATAKKTYVLATETEAKVTSHFEMNPKLSQTLEKLGIKTLFPVQVATFEGVENEQDMIVRSKTGSGKTMAFALPTINRLYNNQRRVKSKNPRAIVVAPTRELALQVHREFSRLARGLKCVSVYGGAPITNQASELRRGVDIVVGTPGRIVDMINRGMLVLGEIETAILDEADEMLNMGFEEDMREIFGYMPSKSERQTLLFSATVPDEIRRIAKKYMEHTQMIDLVGDNQDKIPKDIEMISMPSRREHRMEAIGQILAAEASSATRALIFAETKVLTAEIASHTAMAKSGLRVMPLNGDMSQSARESTLKAFREGRIQCIVATDVAARGLDIPKVDLVIHHSIPSNQDSFVHRAGRTGRAGREGKNILLHDVAEKYDVQDLEKFCKTKFKKRGVPGNAQNQQKKKETLLANIQNVPSNAIAAYEEFAFNVLVNRLGGDIEEKLGQENTSQVVETLAACIAATESETSGLEFSALTGRTGNTTLQFATSGVSFKSKRIGSMRAQLEEILESMLVYLPTELLNDVSVAGSRGKRLASFVEYSKDSSQIYIDVHPALAKIAVAKHSNFKYLTGEILPLREKPKHMVNNNNNNNNNNRGGRNSRRGNGYNNNNNYNRNRNGRSNNNGGGTKYFGGYNRNNNNNRGRDKGRNSFFDDL